MGLWVELVGFRGRLGSPSDIWWGLSALSDGDQYPDVAPLRQFVQVGDIILPWNSSTVMSTT
jgi:hypothetical protein